MKGKKFLWTGAAMFLTISMLMTGCSDTGNNTATTIDSSVATTTAVSKTESGIKYDTEDYYFNWQSKSYKTINLSSGSSTITQSGIFEITGTLKDGSLIVDVDKDTDKEVVYLVLNSVNISSSTSAPIYIKGAKKVVIILENGTKNTVYQGSGIKVDASSEPSAAVFSKSDLTITGGGTLTVKSDYNDGITCKDELRITDGTLVVTSKQDGVVGKDLLAVEKCNMTITAGKDGLRSTNETDADMGKLVITNGTFNITANNDGMQAYSLLQIDGGTYKITTGGGYSGTSNTSGAFGGMGGRPDETNTTTTETETESFKAIKSSKSLVVNGGTFTISSTDDAVHANGDVTINGGTFTIQSGDDGIHSDTTVKITSGTITIKNSYEAIEGKNITVDGGKISMTASDDGFNVNDSAGVLTINGGEVNMNADGDGMDSNGTIKMTGGTVTVDGPTNDGNGPIDYEKEFTITGGTLIAAGSSGMAQLPESGTQASLLMYFNLSQTAKSTITLKDSSGNVIATYTPAKQYASIVISTPKLATGKTYTLYKNDTKVVSFTPSSTVTYLNESGVTTKQGNGMGGGQGGMGGGMGQR